MYDLLYIEHRLFGVLEWICFLSCGDSCDNSYGNSCDNSCGNSCDNSYDNSCDGTSVDSCNNTSMTLLIFKFLFSSIVVIEKLPTKTIDLSFTSLINPFI